MSKYLSTYTFFGSAAITAITTIRMTSRAAAAAVRMTFLFTEKIF